MVDDEPGVVQTIGDWLRGEGYEVASAATAEEAITWFRRSDRPPDAALVDVKLPGATGFELADWLSQDFDFHEVIFVTAFFWEEETRRELVARRSPYFEKPLKFTREVIPFLKRYLAKT